MKQRELSVFPINRNCLYYCIIIIILPVIITDNHNSQVLFIVIDGFLVIVLDNKDDNSDTYIVIGEAQLCQTGIVSRMLEHRKIYEIS